MRGGLVFQTPELIGRGPAGRLDIDFACDGHRQDGGHDAAGVRREFELKCGGRRRDSRGALGASRPVQLRNLKGYIPGLFIRTRHRIRRGDESAQRVVNPKRVSAALTSAEAGLLV